MANSINISFKPTKKQVDEIQSWLIEEENSVGEGFYCNWNLIATFFINKQLALVSLNKKTIGFATWRDTSSQSARIEIFEINRFFRNKGYGKILLFGLLDQFLKKNISVIDLQCSPESSETFWRQLGFIGFPKEMDKWNSGNKSLYKVLVPTLPINDQNTENEIFELWNDEPHATVKNVSTWKWNLVFKEGSRELLNPIIHPCHYDWRIRWSNQIAAKDDKIKYFSKHKIEFGKFLIITQFP